MTPDKLPEELQKDILLSAKAFATGMYPNFPTARDRAEKIFEAGATAWAGWKVKHDELQVQAQRMADALERCSNVASWMDDPYRNKIIEIVGKALQQFKDGKRKEVEPEATLSQSPNPESAPMCMECKRSPATIDYNGHGFYVCKLCDDSLNREFDEEYK